MNWSYLRGLVLYARVVLYAGVVLYASLCSSYFGWEIRCARSPVKHIGQNAR